MATTGNPLSPVYLPPRAKRGSGTRVDTELERVKKLANVLDRYMVDPLVGLVLPGAGDIVGSLLGIYIVAIALRRGASPVIVARMLLNLGIDAAIGIVPLLGDVADIGFKANRKNVALLSHRPTGKATAKDWLFVLGAAVLFAAVVCASVYIMISVIRAIF
jgi:hypothetical protein